MHLILNPVQRHVHLKLLALTKYDFHSKTLKNHHENVVVLVVVEINVQIGVDVEVQENVEVDMNVVDMQAGNTENHKNID